MIHKETNSLQTQWVPPARCHRTIPFHPPGNFVTLHIHPTFASLAPRKSNTQSDHHLSPPPSLCAWYLRGFLLLADSGSALTLLNTIHQDPGLQIPALCFPIFIHMLKHFTAPNTVHVLAMKMGGKLCFFFSTFNLYLVSNKKYIFKSSINSHFNFDT